MERITQNKTSHTSTIISSDKILCMGLFCTLNREVSSHANERAESFFVVCDSALNNTDMASCIAVT